MTSTTRWTSSGCVAIGIQIDDEEGLFYILESDKGVERIWDLLACKMKGCIKVCLTYGSVIWENFPNLGEFT